jgi:hypothetical protein
MTIQAKFSTKMRQDGDIRRPVSISKGKCQTVCKPGSVSPPLARRRRRPFLLDACCQAPRATDPGGSPETDGRTLARICVPPLFGLAPGGVCHAVRVAASAVGSYPTVSTLPRAEARLAVCFLLHFPWGRPRRALPGTFVSVEPGLSSTRPCRKGKAAPRPSDRLARRVDARRKRAPSTAVSCAAQRFLALLFALAEGLRTSLAAGSGMASVWAAAPISRSRSARIRCAM